MNEDIDTQAPYWTEEEADDAWLTRLSFENVPQHIEAITSLIDELGAYFPTRYISEYRHQATQLVLNLLKSEDDERGLAISLDQNKNKAIVKAQTAFGFTHRILSNLRTLLHSEAWITVQEGRRGFGGKKGRATQIRATAKLIDRLCPDGIHFDHYPNYVPVEFRFEDDGKKPKFALSGPAPEGHVQEIDRLNAINNKLRKHHWPMQGPIRRIYNYDIMMGGRIYCRFQGMKKTWMDPKDPTAKPVVGRLYRYRDFHIDGQPVAEIDIKSCHLRMASHIAGFDVGRDPYQEIADIAGCKRNSVKAVMTSAFSSNSRLSTQKAVGDYRRSYQGELIVPKKRFDAIADAAQIRFPQIKLFEGYGMMWFALEGSIALDVIENALEQGFPVLPLHDAVICTEDKIEATQDLLIEAWKKNVGTQFKPEIEIIRYRELREYTEQQE